MSEEMNIHKCPSCGMGLRYDAGSGKLKCDSCGNEYEVDVINSMEQGASQNTEFDWGDYKKNLNKDSLKDKKTYICKSCGAEIIADETTAATVCPYCDSPVILNERVSDSLKPNGIIPFKITKDSLSERIRKFYKGKWLLPKDFFSKNKLEAAQGIYVPFWLFDCDIDGELGFRANRVVTYREGDYEVTRTSYYYLEREGSMSFEKIPVDGSIKMDNDLMDSLEPFDYKDIVDFDDSYLSGFVADRFDGDPDSEKGRASSRVMNTTVQTFADHSGFSAPTLVSNQMKIVKSSVKYVLFPVYLFNAEYRGKKYRYAINGQTGKVAGELPISKLKAFLFFLAAFVVGGGLATLIMMLLHRM